MDFMIELPLIARISSRKAWILNLNNYRNAHYQTLNKAKAEYSKEVKRIVNESGLDDFRISESVYLKYTYFAKTKRVVDVANPCSIIDKFTADALTDLNMWPDDCVKYVRGSFYLFGGVDKLRPRCELQIKAMK